MVNFQIEAIMQEVGISIGNRSTVCHLLSLIVIIFGAKQQGKQG